MLRAFRIGTGTLRASTCANWQPLRCRFLRGSAGSAVTQSGGVLSGSARNASSVATGTGTGTGTDTGTGTGDAEVDKWIGAARAGDADSAFQLGLLLRQRALDGTGAGASESNTGAEVAAEIEAEKKAAKLRRKEKMRRKREAKAAAAAADMPVVTVTQTHGSSSAGASSGQGEEDGEEEDEELTLSWQHWLRRAAGADHVTAQVYLANSLLHPSKEEGVGGSFADIKEAERLYTRAGKLATSATNYAVAKAGNGAGSAQSSSHSADALFNLGTLYFSGAYDTTGALVIAQDEQKSIAAFTQAARLGDAGAQYWIGHCHVSGEGGQPEGGADARTGVQLLEQAAQQGHPAALYYLCTAHRSGLHDHKGKEVIAADKKRFHELLAQAIEAGDVDALFCKADLYMSGSEGVSRDESKAVKYLNEAVQLGHVDAITTLGAMHYAGRGGLQVNKRRAFELYNQASELGSREAWLNLASMHYNGDGVPKSEALAREILAHVKKMEASDENA